MTELNIAGQYHPGELIGEELEARGWAQKDLAHIMGEKPNVVSDLVAGKRDVSRKYARLLASAFGTSVNLWLNLQATYDAATSPQKDDAVVRRSTLYEKAPIREMQKRGWIDVSSDVDALEEQVCRFLEIGSIDETPAFNHAARKSTDYGQVNASQLAWLMRAKKLAEQLVPTGTYSAALQWRDGLLALLSQLRDQAEKIAEIPALLGEAGIRFVIVEHLPKTKIDGACFWLDNNSPVVALSLRYPRLDHFWHSLMHELGHVFAGDGKESPVLDTLFGDGDASTSKAEKLADKFAVDFLVDQAKLRAFIKRQAPHFSKDSIAEFAHELGVHPGTVIGQLQFRQVIPYSHLRAMLINVRDDVTATALTDGWGRTVAV